MESPKVYRQGHKVVPLVAPPCLRQEQASPRRSAWKEITWKILLKFQRGKRGTQP